MKGSLNIHHKLVGLHLGGGVGGVSVIYLLEFGEGTGDVVQ